MLVAIRIATKYTPYVTNEAVLLSPKLLPANVKITIDGIFPISDAMKNVTTDTREMPEMIFTAGDGTTGTMRTNRMPRNAFFSK